MKTATLLKVWVVLGLGWLLFFWSLVSGQPLEEGVAPSTGVTFRLLAWLLLALALAAALVVHILYRRGVRRHSGEVDGHLLIDASATIVGPGVAQCLAAAGVTFVLSGGLLLGAPLAVFGAFLLRRTVLRIDLRERRIWRYTQLLGYPTTPSELLVTAGKPIRLKHYYPRGVGLSIEEVLLVDGLPHEDALRIAEELGHALRREVRDEVAQAEEMEERSALFLALLKLRRLPVLLVPLLLVGLAVAWMIPSSRSALCRLAVAPHTPFSEDFQIPDLRIAGARCLAARPDEENLLALLRLAGTVDPERSPEVLAAATTELLRLAGEAPAEADGAQAESLGRINRWAAQRLNRKLDANGGTMAWHAVEGERHRRAVEELADEDAGVASAAWSSLGAGDLTTPEEFLWALGPALADRRPIHFVLQDEGGLQARSERREGYAGQVLAETVGEAVALQLWGYDGVGSAEFPQEPWTWWAGYARARHLPPGGPGTRP